MIRKGIALIVVLLFVGMMINPSTSNLTPPNKIPTFGVTISFDPPEPDGDNGWYQTPVHVYFHGNNGTIIDYIMIRINGGSWQTVQGASVELSFEGITSYEFIAVDTDSNQWYFGPYELKIDTYHPIADDISIDAYKVDGIWYVELTASAIDDTSGMDRVECLEDEHNETIEGAGPDYVFTFKYCKNIWGKWIYFYHYDKAGNEVVEDFYVPKPEHTSSIIGLIFNPNTINQSVAFFVILARYSYICDGGFRLRDTIMFQDFTIPNDYKGYIGRFFICAIFNE